MDGYRIMVVVGFLLAFAKARMWPVPARPFAAALLLWLPFFLCYGAAIVDVPVARGITGATGLAGSVASHPDVWKTLLAFSLGVISGGWSAAKLRRYFGPAERP